MTPNRAPICFVISSPSGAGKTTLVEEILAADSQIKKTVSHTTRVKRPGEKKGVHYHFTPTSVFNRSIKKGEFLEWAKVYGNLYGTSKKEIERIFGKNKDAILVIENRGAKAIKKLFSNVVFILILPPSMKELKKRITNRRHASDDIQKRYLSAKKEIQDLLWFDYVIVNRNIKKSVELLSSIIRAERAKLRYCKPLNLG